MPRRPLAALTAGLALLLSLVLVPAAPARAGGTDAAGEPGDARFIAQCLDAHLRGGAAAAEQRCVGLLARSCMNAEDGGTTLGQSRCLMREAAAWQVVMDAAWAKLEPQVAAHQAEGPAGDAHGALEAAQAAWSAFAEAECRYAYALWGEGSFRQVAGADCRLNQTARRAIQLRAQLGAEG